MQQSYPSADDSFPDYGVADWQALLDKPVAALRTTLPGQVVIEPLYTASTSPNEQASTLVQRVSGHDARAATQRRGWEICQSYGYANPLPLLALKSDIDHDVQHGVTMLRFEMDALPNNVALASAADLAHLLADVDLTRVAIHMHAGHHSAHAAALLMALWQDRGIGLSQARGALNADPMGAHVTSAMQTSHGVAVLAQDTLNCAFDDMASFLHWCARVEAGPDIHGVQVSAQPYAQAGVDIPSTLGSLIATAVTYIRAMQSRGLSPPAVWDRMRFLWCFDADVFLGIASVRALRRIWLRVGDVLGVHQDGVRSMWIDGETSQRVITARDPWNNLLRGCVSAFAAGVADVDSMHVRRFDEAVLQNGTGPVPETKNDPRMGRRMARNTQLILAEESHLNHVADAAAGSWYVEHLTDQLAHAGWRVFQDIERQGGMLDALTNGWVDARFADAAQQGEHHGA